MICVIDCVLSQSERVSIRRQVILSSFAATRRVYSSDTQRSPSGPSPRGVAVGDAGGVRFVGQWLFLPVFPLGTLLFRQLPAVSAAGEMGPLITHRAPWGVPGEKPKQQESILSRVLSKWVFQSFPRSRSGGNAGSYVVRSLGSAQAGVWPAALLRVHLGSGIFPGPVREGDQAVSALSTPLLGMMLHHPTRGPRGRRQEGGIWADCPSPNSVILHPAFGFT